MKLNVFHLSLLWIIIGIPLLTYLVLKPSFNLSLFGDDWEQLYFMWLEFDVRKTYSWFDFRSYLGPYNFSYLYLGILNHFFGLNSTAYFYTSYLLRVLATISIYWLVLFISKEKLAGFLASLLFIFSVAGLETTDWVFNMNTYLGIFFLNLSIIFYLRIRSSTKFVLSDFILFIFLFMSCLIVVSTRMHGAAPFLILIDLILLFLFEKKKPTTSFYLRLIIPAIILFLAIRIGVFGHVGAGGFTDRLSLGFKTASELLSKGEYTFLFFLPGLIGHIALPDYITYLIVTNFRLTGATLFFFTVLSILVSFTIKASKLSELKSKIAFLIFFSFSFFWTVFIFIIPKINTTVTSDKLFSILVGGETLFLLTWLFFIFKPVNSTLSFVNIFSLLWLITFSLIYWLFNPALLYETTSRYLIMGAVGFAIFFGILLNFLVKKINSKLIVVPLLIMMLWLLANYWSSHKYLTFLEANRNSKTATEIWNSLTDNLVDLDRENPTVFFFTTDNPHSLHWNVVFGFPSHMGLTYQITDLNNTPLPETDYQKMLEYVKDGSPLAKVHGRPVKGPVSIDHIYSYNLSGGKLINQTDFIRRKIADDLKIQN